MNFNQMCSLNDGELIHLFVMGNEKAFNFLVKRYNPIIKPIIFKHIKDADTTDDLIQDVWLKLVILIREKRYQDEGKFGSYIKVMAQNIARDFLRKQKRQATNTVEDWETITKPSLYSTIAVLENAEKSICKSEIRHEMRNMIASLPITQREVIILRLYNDFSFKEIANFTQVSINTALGRMRYAVQNLQKLAEIEQQSA